MPIPLLLLASAIASAAQGGTWDLLHAREGDSLFISPEGALATGDQDGDGVPELLVLSPTWFTIPFLHLLSGASLEPLWVVSAGPTTAIGPMMARVSDVNGDGIPEVALAMPELGAHQVGRIELRSGADGSLLWDIEGTLDWARLGTSIASIGDLNGDGVTDLLAGAPAAVVAGLSQAGEVVILSGKDGTVLSTLGGTTAYGKFGTSVAGIGDLDGDARPDILVGAPGSASASVIGEISAWSGATGSLLHRWTGSSPSDRYGKFVLGTPDLNGDGVADLAVGSPGASPGGLSDAGVVDVRSGATGTVIRRWTGTQAFMRLGSWISIAGDADGDGVVDLALGAPTASLGGATSSGTVLVYSGANGALLHAIHGNAVGEALGTRTAPAGDQDGDGRDDLLVLGGPWAGLQIRSGAGGGMIRQQPRESWHDDLGLVLGSAGDVDQDGRPDYLAGSRYAARGSGAVQLVSGRTGDLIFEIAGPPTHSGFGASLAGGADLNADSVPDFLVGADPSSGFGTVTAYSGLDGSPIRTMGTSGSVRGWIVRLADDVDGDGVQDVLVGNPDANAYRGVAYLVSGGTGVLLQQIDGSAPSGLFGQDLARLDDLDGDGIGDFAVSAPEDSTTALGYHAGRISIYSGATATLIRTIDGPVYDAHFGYAIGAVEDLDGDGHLDLVVGATEHLVGGLGEAGAVYTASPMTGAMLWSRLGSWPDAWYGMAVAALGDVDADGVPDVAAATYAARTGGWGAGAVEILSGADGSLVLLLVGSSSGVGLGSAVTGPGDLDGDGTAELVVGIPGTWGAGGGGAGRIETWSFTADHPYLSPVDLVAGSAAVLQVHEAQGSQVGFGASLVGPGPTWMPQLGLSLALSPPISMLGLVAPNLQGQASLAGTVPAALAGRTIWLQAVDGFAGALRASNMLERVVR